MDRYRIILNLFFVISMFFVACPNEVQGFEILDYNLARSLYKHPWRGTNAPGGPYNHAWRFNPRKRIENVTQNEKASDGGTLFGGDGSPNEDTEIINKPELTTDKSDRFNEFDTENNEVFNKKRKSIDINIKIPSRNNVLKDKRMKDLSGTIVYWPFIF